MDDVIASILRFRKLIQTDYVDQRHLFVSFILGCLWVFCSGDLSFHVEKFELGNVFLFQVLSLLYHFSQHVPLKNLSNFALKLLD